MRLLVLAVLLLALTACTAESGGSADDLAAGFRILNWQIDPPDGDSSRWIHGELRNGTDTAARASVQVISRDASGQVIDSLTFTVSCHRDIPPGATAVIAAPVTRKAEAARFDVTVVGAQPGLPPGSCWE